MWWPPCRRPEGSKTLIVHCCGQTLVLPMGPGKMEASLHWRQGEPQGVQKKGEWAVQKGLWGCAVRQWDAESSPAPLSGMKRDYCTFLLCWPEVQRARLYGRETLVVGPTAEQYSAEPKTDREFSQVWELQMNRLTLPWEESPMCVAQPLLWVTENFIRPGPLGPLFFLQHFADTVREFHWVFLLENQCPRAGRLFTDPLTNGLDKVSYITIVFYLNLLLSLHCYCSVFHLGFTSLVCQWVWVQTVQVITWEWKEDPFI